MTQLTKNHKNIKNKFEQNLKPKTAQKLYIPIDIYVSSKKWQFIRSRARRP